MTRSFECPLCRGSVSPSFLAYVPGSHIPPVRCESCHGFVRVPARAWILGTLCGVASACAASIGWLFLDTPFDESKIWRYLLLFLLTYLLAGTFGTRQLTRNLVPTHSQT